MPFDFEACEPYKVNYKKYFKVFESQRFLEDFSKQQKFLRLWRKRLEDLDSPFPDTIFIKDDDAQIFQTFLTYSTNKKIFINFRIENLNRMIKDNRKSVQKVDVDYFIRPNSPISWNPVNKPLNKPPFFIKPILLVPYLTSPSQALIIDGNHRLTYYANNKPQSRIPVCFLTIKYLVENNMFMSEFDKYFYIMLNEFSLICVHKERYKLDDDVLISKSFLTTNEIFYDAAYQF